MYMLKARKVRINDVYNIEGKPYQVKSRPKWSALYARHVVEVETAQGDWALLPVTEVKK
jgi:hypothetical protein